MNLVSTLTAAWRLANLPAAARFARCLKYPGEEQRRRLLRLMKKNANTAFGREHGFSDIDSIEKFQAQVPLQRWEAVAPWIARVATGEPRVLTNDPVTRLVPTGGSSGGAKLIPWTTGLAQEFQAAIAPWVVDLYGHYPAAAAGKSYWSVSPFSTSQQNNPPGIVPCGFDDDSAYVGGWLRPLVSATFAVPSCLRHITDLATFRYATLRCLLGQAHLSLISVWHPSFLELLLDAAPIWRGELIRDIRCGGITPPTPIPATILAEMTGWLRANPRRADELMVADWQQVQALWPRLALVSCWGDGAAAPAFSALQRRMGAIPLQAKGLLATEGVITIPYARQQILSVTSHVYEFIDDHGRSYGADEIKEGICYEVALTTSGGLYRYRLGDRVRVTGSVERTPCLQFLGRGDRVVDLCGEKLDEAFVAQCLSRIIGDTALFAMLAPDQQGATLGYTLYVAGEFPTRLAPQLDTALSVNPQYRLARDLGQLNRPRIFCITDNAAQTFAAHMATTTSCLGAIKPVALHHQTGWSQRFTGAYLATEETR